MFNKDGEIIEEPAVFEESQEEVSSAQNDYSKSYGRWYVYPVLLLIAVSAYIVISFFQ